MAYDPQAALMMASGGLNAGGGTGYAPSILGNQGAMGTQGATGANNLWDLPLLNTIPGMDWTTQSEGPQVYQPSFPTTPIPNVTPPTSANTGGVSTTQIPGMNNTFAPAKIDVGRERTPAELEAIDKANEAADVAKYGPDPGLPKFPQLDYNFNEVWRLMNLYKDWQEPASMPQARTPGEGHLFNQWAQANPDEYLKLRMRDAYRMSHPSQPGYI